MKKVMWAISVFSLVLTALALQFMPDSVPMHYDLAGSIDRWGSKYENLILPGSILLQSLLWHVILTRFEKKAAKSSEEKERAEALSNAKVLKIVGVSMTAMFTVMQGFLLYSAYAAARANSPKTPVPIGNISYILVGVVLIVLGNYMPKTKKNPFAGIRTRFSMYNDTTWKKSNRFGGIVFILTGFLTILTAVFAKADIASILLLIYILAATAITVLYSYKVYQAELAQKERDS